MQIIIFFWQIFPLIRSHAAINYAAYCCVVHICLRHAREAPRARRPSPSTTRVATLITFNVTTAVRQYSTFGATVLRGILEWSSRCLHNSQYLLGINLADLELINAACPATSPLSSELHPRRACEMLACVRKLRAETSHAHSAAGRYRAIGSE